MICPSRCSSFKMDCKLLHKAWKENDKLTSKNWKLTADISDLKLRLSDSKILHKVNMKDKKSELNVMLHENKKLTKEVVRLQAHAAQPHRRLRHHRLPRRFRSFTASLSHQRLEHNKRNDRCI